MQFTLRQGFDDLSRRTSARLEYAKSDGSWTKGDFENTYGYDALSRMTSIVQKGQALTGTGPPHNAVAQKRVDLTYNPLDQIETITRRSGTETTSPDVFVTTQKYAAALAPLRRAWLEQVNRQFGLRRMNDE